MDRLSLLLTIVRIAIYNYTIGSWATKAPVVVTGVLLALLTTGYGCSRVEQRDRSLAREDSGHQHASRPSWRLRATTTVRGYVFLDSWHVDRDLVFYAALDLRAPMADLLELVATDVASNQELWNISLPTGMEPTELIGFPEGPVVAWEPGYLRMAFDADTGVELWREETRDAGWDAEILTRPPGALAISPEGVLVLSRDSLQLIDPHDGRVRWSLKLGCDGSYLDYASPIMANGRIFFIVDDVKRQNRHLLAVEEHSGQLLWDVDLGPIFWCGDPPPVPNEVGGCSVGQQGVVCLQYRAMDIQTINDSTPLPLVVCFDPASGKKRWELLPPGWPWDPGVRVCGEFVLVPIWDEELGRWRCLVYTLLDGHLVCELPPMTQQPRVEVLNNVMVCTMNGDGFSVLAAPSFEPVSQIPIPDLPSLCWETRVVSGYAVAVGSEHRGNHNWLTHVVIIGQ